MTEATVNDRTAFRLSIDSRQLIERLGELNPGEHVTYAELSKLIGRNIRTEARACLSTAIRHHLRAGIVFGPIRNVGVKRLEDLELVGEGDRSMQHLRRHVRRSAQKLASFKDFAALPEGDKTRVLATQSLLGAMAMFSQPQAIKKMQTGVTGEMKELAFGKTLALFAGTKDVQP
jgi:hypothetical protein